MAVKASYFFYYFYFILIWFDSDYDDSIFHPLSLPFHSNFPIHVILLFILFPPILDTRLLLYVDDYGTKGKKRKKE